MNTRVLIADDSKLIRTIIADVVHDIGVTEVVEATDGNEAFDAFLQGEIDLIVMDWQMPGRSGLEVVEAIRETGSQVPIVMVTATGTSKEHVVDAVEVGVSDYVLKPFDPVVLREKLAKYCSANRSDPVEAPLETV